MGDFGFLLLWHGSALFLLYAYTDILGIPATLAGAIYLIAMIWDAVSDPLVAAWAERRAIRTGKYAPIIGAAALPLGIAYAAVYLAPPLTGWSLAVWALALHLIFRTVYTIASMPYNTLPIRLATTGRDRNALSGFRVVGAASGALTTAIVTPLLVGGLQTHGLDEADSYQGAASAIGLLAAVCLFSCSRLVREPETPSHAAPAESLTHSIWSMFTAATGNAPLIRLLAIMIGGTLAQGFFLQNILYYLTHVLGRADLITPVLGSAGIAVILGAPVWVFLAARTSKKTSLMAGLVVASAGYALMILAPAGPSVIPLLSAGLASIGGAAIPVMLWSMMPDAIEHGEVETGVRIEARTFGLATFCQKATVGLTAAIIGLILGLSGYSGEVSVPAGAASAITIMVAGLPAIIVLVLVWIIRPYPIDDRRHQDILKTLRTRKADTVAPLHPGD